MTEKFTQGNWIAAGSSFGDKKPRFLNSVVTDKYQYDDDCYNICDVLDECDIETMDANAYLISAAPEMYYCLKEILSLASTETTKGEDVYIKDFAKIRKILQKARGEI
jgi:hypothetical protein